MLTIVRNVVYGLKIEIGADLGRGKIKYIDNITIQEIGNNFIDNITIRLPNSIFMFYNRGVKIGKKVY